MTAAQIIEAKLARRGEFSVEEVLESVLLTYDGLGIPAKREALYRLLKESFAAGARAQISLDRDFRSLRES